VDVKKIKLAIPTKGDGGLEDVVSEVFGRANTFTIIDVEGGAVMNVDILQNPAVTYKHGAGPIVVKTLVDLGVNFVVSGELGPGVSTLLDQFKVSKVIVKPGTIVKEVLKIAGSHYE